MKFTLQLLLSFFFLLFSGLVLSAQDKITMELECSARLSPYLQEWIADNSLRLTLKNLSGAELAYTLETTLLLEGKPLAKTSGYSSRKHSLAAGAIVQLRTSDIFIMREIRFFGRKQPNGAENVLTDSGKYSVCVNIMDSTGTAYLGKAVCQQRTIVPSQAAQPFSPADKDTLHVHNTISFTWKGVHPYAPKNVHYILRCFPVGDSQYPAQAVRSNDVFFEAELVDSTSYVWTLPDSRQHSPHRIVWSVQSKNADGTPLGSSDGYSQLMVVPVVWEKQVGKGKNKESRTQGKATKR